MACEEELEPLEEVLPQDPEERTKWILDARTKPAHFDVEWESLEDSKLLQGIYQYGMGSWEQIKLDPALGLGDKILFNDDKKPQAKHLQSRAEYLLKILKKQIELKKGITKPKRQRKTREAKTLTKEIIDHDDISSNDEGSNTNNTTTSSSMSKKLVKIKKEEEADDSSSTIIKNDKGKDKKDKKKEKKEKKMAGPMHFTANNEPRALDVLGDLDPSIFNEVSTIKFGFPIFECKTEIFSAKRKCDQSRKH